LDLFMPFMTGWELVDLLCRDSRFSNLALLVMSGLSVHGDASAVTEITCVPLSYQTSMREG